MAKHRTYKRTTEGKRTALSRKAARAAKYAVRPLDIDALAGTLSRPLPA